MSIITISSIFNDDYNDYEDFCNNGVVANFIDTTTFETTLATYIYSPIWLRYKDTPIKFSNDEKGKDAFLRNFYNQLSEVVFDFHNYAKENIEYFLYQNDVTKQGKPMSKTITSGIAPINQKIDQALDSTNLASGTGSQFVSETVYNGIAWHKLVEGYFTPNRKTALLKAFQWLFISVYSPETKYDDKIEQVRYVELSFVDDDNNIIDEQKVYPTKSYFTMSEVDIQRPLMLDPQNIKKDVDIAGVVGTFDVNIYPRIYDVLRLDNPDGEIIYNTPSGYDGVEGVTITIPSTAVAENIKDGVNIGGIIGTYTGSVDYLPYRVSNISDYDVTLNVDNLKPYAFYWDLNVKNVTLNLTGTTSLVNQYLFNNSGIKSFTGNNIVTLSSTYMLSQCHSLESISFPDLVNASTANYMCSQSENLSSVNMPLVTRLGVQMFYQCTQLKQVNLPSLQRISSSCFSMSGLTSITLPAFTTPEGARIFENCTSLVTANLPVVDLGSSYSNTFNGCTSLTTVMLNATSYIPSNCFKGCTSLTDITLAKTARVTLSNVNAFDGITGLVTIHVPSNLISSYQTASNWSTLYNNGVVTFVAI